MLLLTHFASTPLKSEDAAAGKTFEARRGESADARGRRMGARDFTRAFLSLVEDRNRPKVGLWPFPKVVPPPPPPTEERKQVGILLSFSFPLLALDPALLSAWPAESCRPASSLFLVLHEVCQQQVRVQMHVTGESQPQVRLFRILSLIDCRHGHLKRSGMATSAGDSGGLASEERHRAEPGRPGAGRAGGSPGLLRHHCS